VDQLLDCLSAGGRGVSSCIREAFPDDAASTGSSSAMNREELFLTQLPDIERVIRWVCARRCLRGADAEDFASAVKCRLIENDYEVLARFEGRASLRTYLTVIVNRLYLDFQVHRFGKWRSSALARRLGPVAVMLERLMLRDGLTFDQAWGVLGTAHRVSETRDALYEISLRLPLRIRRGPAPLEAGLNDAIPAPSGLEHAERQALAERASVVIRAALAGLPARDRLFLRVHLVEGLTVAQVSRTLGIDLKALYRRNDALFRGLRAALESEGIGAEDARELLSAVDWDADFFGEVGPSDTGAGERGSRPSPLPTDAHRPEGDM
jgi:RNA polymerase sigma factor for flagellar operon FliA